MSQADVQRILERNQDRWLTTKEISKKAKTSYSTITSSLLKMVKYKEVKRKMIRIDNWRVYVYKLR